MTSFRTRPKSSIFSEVLDIQADPYAYFLQDVSRRQFEQNLKDRGYDSTITHPDRGHTLDLQTFSMFGQRLTGRSGYSSGFTWDYINHVNALPALYASFETEGPFQGAPGIPASFPASNLPAFAQKAYARSAPTYEEFNLARSLAELREFPRVKLDFLSKSIAEWRFQGDKWLQKGANRLGDDSLNILFGWAPLVSDMIGLCKALVSLTNGVIQEPVVTDPLHRTFRGPDDVQTYSTSGTTRSLEYRPASILTDSRILHPGPYVASPGPRIAWSATKRYSRSQWFEASFTKFLPIGFDASNYLQKADLLLNTELTPLSVWQLSPWTWLSDWFVDISSTIAANQAASDKSLISHYAYAMEETRCEIFLDYEVLPSDTQYSWSASGPTKGSFVTSTVWKRRLRANPFGFVPGGPSGLNPFRTAVLAALGLSRL